ncbi:MAG: proteosome catalytic beta-4, partial [Actinomycetota bacterium]
MSTKAIANLCRTLIARELRNRKELLAVELLVAGSDTTAHKPILYWLDNVGSLVEVPYAAHGVHFSSIYSFMDRFAMKLDSRSDKEDGPIVRSAAFQLLCACWANLQRRSASKIGSVRTKCIT